MAITDPWIERLSEYLDGELAAAERETMDAHLAGCAECRVTLDELRAIAVMADRLEDQPPGSDLWPAIAARIGEAREAAGAVALAEWRRRSERRFSFSLPQLAAASIALMLFSGGTVWLARPRGPSPAAAPTITGTEAAPGRRDAPAQLVTNFGGVSYETAVRDLERVLADGREVLDPATVQVLEQNLAIIDRAIEDARRAVAEDPANVYLNNHLAESMKRKLELLRQATAIVRAQS